MSKKTFSARLSTDSINKVKDELIQYNRRLNDKVAIAINKLAQIGIQVGRQNCGNYSGYIFWQQDSVKLTQIGVSTMIIVTDEPIIRYWVNKQGIQSEQISPMLMAEFGSGWWADVKRYSATSNAFGSASNSLGVGQGTFPGQKHAFDMNGWYWEDLKGDIHHSYGEKPTYPVYYASVAMASCIVECFREAFK